jgi:ABC-type amino acid transport substrate-binding protein
LTHAEVDVIYPMGFNAERASQFLQSAWTWQNPDVFVSLKPIDTSDLALAIGSKLGSPQDNDYVPDGYSSVQSTYEYSDLPRLLSSKAVDAVIVPKSVYLAMAATWPNGVQTSPGKPRGIGFYLNKRDPKGLLKVLNESIGKCRIQATPQKN